MNHTAIQNIKYISKQFIGLLWRNLNKGDECLYYQAQASEYQKCLKKIYLDHFSYENRAVFTRISFSDNF